MLKINLLPLERRHKDKTPILRLLAIYAAVVLSLVVLFWDVASYLKIGRGRQELDNQKKELVILKEATRGFDVVQKEVNNLKKRTETIETIQASRSFLWWETIDQLLDVICDNPKVWLVSLEGGGLSSKSRSKPGQTGQQIEAELKFDCLSAGLDINLMTNFRTILKNHPGLKADFPVINEPPEFEATVQTDYKEGYALRFDITLGRVKQKPKK